jgi:Fe-S cluster assembly scaffold protein SufB
MDKIDIINSIQSAKDKDAWRFFDFQRFENAKEANVSLNLEENISNFTTGQIDFHQEIITKILLLNNNEAEKLSLNFHGNGSYNLFINGHANQIKNKNLNINIQTQPGSQVELNLILINNNENLFLKVNSDIEDSILKFNFINLYSTFVRFEPLFNLKNAKSVLEYNGLNILNKRDFCDTFSNINHYASQSTSTQIQKNVVDGYSKSVFTGNILIEKNLKEVNAKQLSRNILISKDASSLSRPQLEIYSFDVKCAHGSSTGQLNDDEFFYFSSRGIKPDRAKKLLLEAQANEILFKIQDPKVRQQISKWVQL